MKKTHICLLGFLSMIFLASPVSVLGQASKLEVHIYSFYSNADNETTDGDIEHTWKFFFKDNFATSYGVERCHALTTGHNVTNLWHTVNDTYTAKTYFGSVPTTFDFHLRGYEDDAGDRCEENSRDEQKESYFYSHNLADLAPGVWSQIFQFGAGRYKVRYALRYTPIAPSVQSVSPAMALICADQPVTLTGALEIPNIAGLNYQWQYNVQGETEPNPNYNWCMDDCYRMLEECQLNQWGNCYEMYYQCMEQCEGDYPPLPVWKDLGSSTTNAILFQPLSTIFSSGLNWNTNVQFRARVYTSETSSAYGASSGFKGFSPPAPTSPSIPYVKQLACLSNNGVIALDNIGKVFSSYKYILKRGDVSTLGCEPQTNDCLVDVAASGESTSSSLEITGLEAGIYSLFLLNPGGAEGVCPRRIGGPIDVQSVPALTVTPGVPSVIECNGSNTGSVQVTVSNGKPDQVNHTLLNKTDNRTWTIQTTTSNPSFSFTGLSPGAYELTSTDGCTQTSVEVFEVEEQAKITEVEFQPTPATCNVPGNGAMRIEVSRSTGDHIKTISNSYSYTLLKDGAAFRSHESTDKILTWESLPPAAYTLIVTEKDAGYCNRYEKTFNIAPAETLAIRDIQITNVSCFGGKNGKITFTGLGGTGSYTFILSGDSSATNTNPIFEKLKAGNYSLAIVNQLAGCEDSFETSFVVTQPAELKATAAKRDITCYDRDDGELTTVAVGGADGYDYQWQVQVNDSWADLNATDPVVMGISEGDYRVIVMDKNQCVVESNVVNLVRPDALQIDSVKVSDIKCSDDKGRIEVYSSGGTGQHAFEYVVEDNSTFTTFTATSPMEAGMYKIRITDANGCTLTDEENRYEITAPPAALAFTYEQSDYNGYHVSCFEGSNGYVVLTASGGNGGLYSGYEFRADQNAFSENDTLKHLAAGEHLISARDGRGCVSERVVTFEEPAPLTVLTKEKKDVDCHGASTGIIELEVNGGTGSFQFMLGDLVEDTARFENLPAAEYVISIVDNNECATAYTETIVNLHQPITSEFDVTDVLCHGGADGVITLALSGGAPGDYVYELNGIDAQPNPISGLNSGVYDVLVRDVKGCTHAVEDVVVGEPDMLKIDDVDYDDIVCFAETGSIRVFSSGGTSPYVFEYSLDDGATFSAFNADTPLGPASYAVRVVDDHDCITPYGEILMLTEPPALLDFTYQLSDYNGYNISCFGGDNGYIEIAPSGGNGANYSGYEFAIDDGAFDRGTRLNNINAGTHAIHTRDGRGCVTTQDVLFRQSDDRLEGSIIEKEDVECFYEEDGAVQVLARGGASPYRYWIDASFPQDNPMFTGLAVGEYVVTISDINQCESEVTVNIASIYPAFALTPEVTDVNCHGGQDGSIHLTVTGGVSPFSYAWKDQSLNSNLLEQIGQGSYEVTVTDDAGCFVTTLVHVDQPDQRLAVSSISTLAACYGQDNGSITITAAGGTAPYQYSIDGGETYHESTSLYAPAGAFDVLVKDDKGCRVAASAEVSQRNSKPEPNFLVSSKQNALDTLVLTDVSVPKPDSIDWILDPEALLLSDSQWAPEVFFSTEGNFPVTMVSYFGDCAYETTKTILLHPFDPDRTEQDLPDANPIQAVDVTPNPNNGAFTITVKLNRKRNLSLIVYSVTGNILYSNIYADADEVSQAIDLSTEASGVYLIRAITETDAREVRIVVNR